MRLRLVHKLSLLMLSFALVAVLALGGFTAWNLRHGFGQYLAARDVVHLEAFRDLVEKKLAIPANPSVQSLSMHALLNELRGEPADAPPPSSDHPPPASGLAGLMPRPHPRPGRDAWPERLSVVGLDGQTLLGRGDAPASADPVDRPIRAGGVLVAWARLRQTDTIPGTESRFLRDQYVRILGTSVGLVLLALASAAWLARRWVRPLAAVAQTTGQLARGEFSARIERGQASAERTDEIGDVVVNINHMAESLQRLEQSRRRWLADISHELRTPLTVMQGDIEALCDGVRPLRAEAVQVLREEVLHLGKLVNDLHLLAMSDLQNLPCHFAPMNPAELLQKLVQRHAPRASAQGLALSLDLPGEPFQASWDATRMAQLCVNLLENSIRYTHAPGQIVLRLRRVGARAFIDVEDSAPGVDAHDMASLFEPLYRADRARTRALGGSGLGLAICEAIAHAHGGTVAASASSLGGLHVQVDLPLQPPETLLSQLPDPEKGARP
ncbi:MAG: hypothetical protein CFE38_16285 [Comamonadaceae bacterium PBBC1]|nr:MAG: hypothetical protein CFE38_16285 [Comamonadaceae bacterium PBBC1]